MTEEKPLPSWILDRGNGYYTIDVDAAIAAGQTLPIQLGDIPQFAPFFTNPPSQRGSIDFKSKNREHLYFIPEKTTQP